MLADVPMGESPIGGDSSVTTVVISDRGKGDRPDGKLGSKSSRWLEGTPVRSARGTSNSRLLCASALLFLVQIDLVGASPKEEIRLPRRDKAPQFTRNLEYRQAA